jgi:hypothetical protein
MQAQKRKAKRSRLKYLAPTSERSGPHPNSLVKSMFGCLGYSRVGQARVSDRVLWRGIKLHACLSSDSHHSMDDEAQMRASRFDVRSCSRLDIKTLRPASRRQPTYLKRAAPALNTFAVTMRSARSQHVLCQAGRWAYERARNVRYSMWGFVRLSTRQQSSRRGFQSGWLAAEYAIFLICGRVDTALHHEYG